MHLFLNGINNAVDITWMGEEMLRSMKRFSVALIAIFALAIISVFAFASGIASTGGQSSVTKVYADSSSSVFPEGVSMFRLYNPNSGEHFYTADENERANLISVGWNDEGIGWIAPAESNTPVYRMYNPVAGEHHYTMDANEKDALVAAGWNYEGVGWCSDDAKGQPLYRDYNSNAYANNHNYTTDASEHQMLVGVGWQDEGLAWYAMQLTVVFVDYDGSVLSLDKYDRGTKAAKIKTPDAPTRAEDVSNTYEFAGWSPEIADVTSHAAYIATYTAIPKKDIHHARVKVKGYDTFTITIDPGSAPITANNFISLVKRGYYNGLAFYRIDNEFCLQGGSKGNSSGGQDPSLTPIKGEFSSNGVNNPLADNFQKGTVAMARANDPNSATSAFFVTLASSMKVSASLNGNYAAFGAVDEAGMKVVDAICNDYKAYATGNMGAITDPAHMPIIESITMLD